MSSASADGATGKVLVVEVGVEVEVVEEEEEEEVMAESAPEDPE